MKSRFVQSKYSHGVYYSNTVRSVCEKCSDSVCVTHQRAVGLNGQYFLLSVIIILRDPPHHIILNVTKKTETFKCVLRLQAIIGCYF